jgi:pimeloyl-ACP methyl ester carboxylesterase
LVNLIQNTVFVTGHHPPLGLEAVTCLPETPRSTVPILCVHGAWHGAWCYTDTFLPTFAKAGYTTHAMSFRGHGASDGTTQLARLTDYLTDLQTVIDSLETPPFIVAHSMGALVTLMLMQTRHGLPGAVLLAPIPTAGTLPLAWRLFSTRPLAALSVLFTGNAYEKVANAEANGHHFFSPQMSAEEAEAYMRRFTHESLVATGWDAGLWISRFHRPAQVDSPLLFLSGQYDTLFTVNEIERTASVYGTSARVYPTMGHDLMLDPGWQTVADDSLRWIAQHTHD